jgi:hypothetical protein
VKFLVGPWPLFLVGCKYSVPPYSTRTVQYCTVLTTGTVVGTVAIRK